MTTQADLHNQPTPAAEPRPPEAREAAQARAYLDLWEIHLALVAVEGPVSRPPARQG